MIIIQGQMSIYLSNFVIKISIKSVINVGIPLYNKVPINVKNLMFMGPCIILIVE